MKITLDLTSVVVGGAVALALGVVAGFSPQVTSVPAARPATAVTTMGANRPAARDVVFLQGGSAPFLVPSGKILVVTSFAYRPSNPISTLWINGAPMTIGGFWGANDDTQADFASGGAGGIPIAAGDSVELRKVNGSPSDSSEWATGYLEDA